MSDLLDRRVSCLPCIQGDHGACLLAPETAYRLLDEIRTLLDDVYGDHPFRLEVNGNDQ